MKLTAEQIDKIERVLAMVSEQGHRAALVEFDIYDLQILSGFVRVVRGLGIEVPAAKHKRRLTHAEARLATMWMAANAGRV